MEQEAGDESEVGGGGLTRREAMRRGAIAGGALLWVTPMVQTVGMNRALAQQASPRPQLRGISFIELRFTCGGTAYYAKVESINSATQFDCEGPNPGQTCGVNDSGAQNGCGRFTLSDLVFNGNDLIRVTVDLNCGGQAGVFLEGQSKCGQACVPAQTVDSDTRVFFGCPK